MKKKILLVDDRAEILTLLKSFLNEKYEVETAGSVAQAMNRVTSDFFPDIVVTDLVMPEADGRILVSHFKASKVYGRIPIIVLSNIDRSNERIELLRLGASDFVSKPFNPEELEIRIQKLIDRPYSVSI